MSKSSNRSWDKNYHQMSAFLKKYREVRGMVPGTKVPRTTYDDIDQQIRYWGKQLFEARRRRPILDETIPSRFTDAVVKFRSQLKDAKRDVEYPENRWIWFEVLTRLALHLDRMNTTPTKTEMIFESIQEAIDDRIDDVSDLLDGAGSVASDAADAVSSAASSAVDAVTEVGEEIWGKVKFIAIVGGGLVGAAIVLPPVIRAFRD